jgi:hypothetical protein
VGGAGNSKSKTLPKSRERSEEICTQSRGVVAVPVVIEPVRVPVPSAVVPIEVTDVEVAVGVAVVYEASSMPLPIEYSNRLYRIRERNSLKASHQVSSLFEVSTYTTPSQTLAGDARDIWILASVAENRDRPRMHLSPHTV